MLDLHDVPADTLSGRSDVAAATNASVPTSWPPEPDSTCLQVNQQFLGMLKAFRHSGGLLRAQEAAARCKPHSGVQVKTLVGWIAERKVVSFEWLSRTWLPLFQFNRADMSRHSGLDEVLAELVEVYDNWQIARWFSLPNPWLGHARPSDKLASAAADVLKAACAERVAPTMPRFVCC